MVPLTLPNQYEDDQVLRSYLSRVLPADVLKEIEPSLSVMGQLAGDELYRLQQGDRLNEPRLTQWDAWGNRVDEVEVTPVWHRARLVAAEHGVVATAYEQRHGRFSRLQQASLAYLFTPSTDIYSCPLAMTDGAARTLMASGHKELIARVVPHFTTRNPEEFWTSGQWMTEITGGSDVGTSTTVARRSPVSPGEEWSLYGAKWFASAINSPVALTLARPEGNPPGGRGLALFFVELRDERGRLRNIQIERLKDKLGTRKVPTAELTLNGTPAQLVMGTTDGVRNIAPLLNTTRLWNGISAVSLMRRGITLVRSFATTRVVFRSLLASKPLHIDTLASLDAEFEGAFQLAFYIAELTGKSEAGELNDDERLLLRVLTPVMKLTTGKQAVAVLSEVLECFGGAGYVEDTGLPQLLRDAQVLPIWEGTTNVLSLDTLRALGSGDNESSALSVLRSVISECVLSARDARLARAAQVATSALEHAHRWLINAPAESLQREAGARRFALTLGRGLELALLIQHAQWALDHDADGRSIESAARLANTGVDFILDEVV